MKIKRRALRVIQHDDWSTSNRDPGNNCPKCGGEMRYTQDYDDVIFCENSFDDERCDFQYSFTDRELGKNRQKELDDLDTKATADAARYVKEHGRPVFGVTDPSLFILPSAEFEEATL